MFPGVDFSCVNSRLQLFLWSHESTPAVYFFLPCPWQGHMPIYWSLVASIGRQIYWCIRSRHTSFPAPRTKRYPWATTGEAQHGGFNNVFPDCLSRSSQRLIISHSFLEALMRSNSPNSLRTINMSLTSTQPARPRPGSTQYNSPVFQSAQANNASPEFRPVVP